MSSDLVTVSLDDRLTAVKEIFDNTQFHHLLVVEGKKLHGIVSDRDLLKALSPNVDSNAATIKDLASLNKRAHQIMSPNPKTINEDAVLSDAVDIFNNYPISCIPVVNNKQEPVGIVSWRDIMREVGMRLKMLKQREK